MQIDDEELYQDKKSKTHILRRMYPYVIMATAIIINFSSYLLEAKYSETFIICWKHNFIFPLLVVWLILTPSLSSLSNVALVIALVTYLDLCYITASAWAMLVGLLVSAFILSDGKTNRRSIGWAVTTFGAVLAYPGALSAIIVGYVGNGIAKAVREQLRGSDDLSWNKVVLVLCGISTLPYLLVYDVDLILLGSAALNSACSITCHLALQKNHTLVFQSMMQIALLGAIMVGQITQLTYVFYMGLTIAIGGVVITVLKIK